MRKQSPNQSPPSSSCHLAISWGLGSRLEAEALFTHHHGLEDLGGDGRQHALVVVLSDAGEDAGELASNRPEEDAQGDVDIL